MYFRVQKFSAPLERLLCCYKAAQEEQELAPQSLSPDLWLCASPLGLALCTTNSFGAICAHVSQQKSDSKAGRVWYCTLAGCNMFCIQIAAPQHS